MLKQKLTKAAASMVLQLIYNKIKGLTFHSTPQVTSIKLEKKWRRGRTQSSQVNAKAMEEGDKAGVSVMLEDIELRFSRENSNPKRERKWQLGSRHNWSTTKLGFSNRSQLHFQTDPPSFNCFNFVFSASHTT